MGNRYIYGFNRELYLEYHGHIDGQLGFHREYHGNTLGI